ncbi:MAG: tetratricopeptide repeat protein [Planctomycetota bacterium]
MNTRSAIAICVSLAAAPPLVGCGSGQRFSDDELRHPNQLMAEALRLAERAEQARRRGNELKAIELYRESIAVYDAIALPHNNLGMLLMEQGDALGASRAFRRAADLATTDPRPFANLGYMHAQRGWTDDALRYYELALERDPNDLESLRGVIRAAESEGRAEQTDLDHIRRATFRETDPRWISYIERQKFRVENQIRLQRLAERNTGGER